MKKLKQEVEKGFFSSVSSIILNARKLKIVKGKDGDEEGTDFTVFSIFRHINELHLYKIDISDINLLNTFPVRQKITKLIYDRFLL